MGDGRFSKEERIEKATDLIFDNPNIVRNKPMMCDTLIGGHLSYVVVNNGEVITTQPYGDEGPMTIEYADNSVFIWLKSNDGKAILTDKEINKYSFASIIPQGEIGQYQLWRFSIKEADEHGGQFSVNICVPETDLCYFIDLYVSKDGEIAMTEMESVWEE